MFLFGLIYQSRVQMDKKHINDRVQSRLAGYIGLPLIPVVRESICAEFCEELEKIKAEALGEDDHAR